MQGLHPVQKHILKKLLINTELRFSEMQPKNLSSDHFIFHTKQLVEQEIIRKKKNGLYCLTTQGKEYANRFDIERKEIFLQKQAKLGILVVARDKAKNFLIQQRLKQPFYGYHGFISGKIRWGEPILEAAARELKEEAGLEAADLTLQGIEHKIDYSKQGRLLEDKFFYIVEATNLSGNLQTIFEAGKNQWLSKEQLLQLPNLFEDVQKIIQAVAAPQLLFFEDKYYYETQEY